MLLVEGPLHTGQTARQRRAERDAQSPPHRPGPHQQGNPAQPQHRQLQVLRPVIKAGRLASPASPADRTLGESIGGTDRIQKKQERREPRQDRRAHAEQMTNRIDQVRTVHRVEMELIDAAVSGVGAWLHGALPDGALRSLLVDGIVAGAGSVLVFLPQILILFFFILLLEDSGYLPRAAFLLKRTLSGLLPVYDSAAQMRAARERYDGHTRNPWNEYECGSYYARAMASYEEEFQVIRWFVGHVTGFLLFPKKIDLRGGENFIREGPNIIVGNHIGAYKDVSVLLRTVPRMIYFTANKMFFTREGGRELVLRHLHRHMGRFGGFVHVLLLPYYTFMVVFISGHIARIGTIPVDIYGSKRESILKCEDYLRKGRAVITLQGRGRVHPKEPHPYVKEFRRGVSIMAYNLRKENGLDVPVTPLSFFGTHIMWGVPATIKVNVGKPMFIRDYWTGEETSTVEKFRSALERTVSGLFLALFQRCFCLLEVCDIFNGHLVTNDVSLRILPGGGRCQSIDLFPILPSQFLRHILHIGLFR